MPVPIQARPGIIILYSTNSYVSPQIFGFEFESRRLRTLAARSQELATSLLPLTEIFILQNHVRVSSSGRDTSKPTTKNGAAVFCTH